MALYSLERAYFGLQLLFSDSYSENKWLECALHEGAIMLRVAGHSAWGLNTLAHLRFSREGRSCDAQGSVAKRARGHQSSMRGRENSRSSARAIAGCIGLA